MVSCALLAISLACASIMQAAGKKNPGKRVPAQLVYDASSAASKVQNKGCTVTSWDGMDSDGMSGPPWVSYINCTEGASFHSNGVAIHGAFQVWLHYGQLSLNDQQHYHMGESVWVASGARANLKVSGAAYVAGAKFELDPSAEESEFTSSFEGPKHRGYWYEEAQSNVKNSTIQDDEHICNGTSPSRDIVFGSQTGVDPASVVVVNCAAASTPEGNFVWSHFHPFGALYLALSGEICFATKDVICVQPGTARWTSANLQYYEYFRKINASNTAADAVRDIAGRSDSGCQHPNVFAVTNFDSSTKAGVPNLVDWPSNAHSNELALGIGPWGVFPRMTVQATRVIVKASAVMLDGELENDHTLV